MWYVCMERCDHVENISYYGGAVSVEGLMDVLCRLEIVINVL